MNQSIKDQMTSGQIIDRAKQIYSQLDNAGSEKTMDEVNHNDELREEFEFLIENFPESVKQAIRLNHI